MRYASTAPSILTSSNSPKFHVPLFRFLLRVCVRVPKLFLEIWTSVFNKPTLITSTSLYIGRAHKISERLVGIRCPSVLTCATRGLGQETHSLWDVFPMRTAWSCDLKRSVSPSSNLSYIKLSSSSIGIINQLTGKCLSTGGSTILE